MVFFLIGCKKESPKTQPKTAFFTIVMKAGNVPKLIVSDKEEKGCISDGVRKASVGEGVILLFRVVKPGVSCKVKISGYKVFGAFSVSPNAEVSGTWLRGSLYTNFVLKSSKIK